jgi:hypothetical protein
MTALTTRRAMMRGAATVSAVVALPALPASAQQPDPIFAAIEARKRVEAATTKAVKDHNAAEHQFRLEHGRSGPDALNKECRDALIESDPAFRMMQANTHELIDKVGEIDWIRPHTDVIAQMHAELDRQTAIYNETVKPLDLAVGEAWDAYSDAVTKLVNTAPTTAAGLVALLTYIRNNEELFGRRDGEPVGVGFLRDDDEGMGQLIDTLAKSARAWGAVS